MFTIRRVSHRALIFDLAYHNNSVYSKILLLLLGGIVTLLKNIFKGNFSKAFFASVSNSYAVAITAEENLKRAPNIFWRLLKVWATAQTRVLWECAVIGTDHFGLPKKDEDYDALVAVPVRLLRKPHLADSWLSEGLIRFTDSILLQVRRVQMKVIKKEEAGLSEVLLQIESYFSRCNSPELQLHVVENLLMGWHFHGNMKKVEEWEKVLWGIPNQGPDAIHGVKIPLP